MQNDRYRKRTFKEEEHENDKENSGDPVVSMHGHYVDADPGVGGGRSLGPAGSWYEEAVNWAVDAVTWCVGAGIINGMTETTIVPQGTGTRAQMATMLMRYSN